VLIITEWLALQVHKFVNGPFPAFPTEATKPGHASQPPSAFIPPCPVVIPRLAGHQDPLVLLPDRTIAGRGA